MSIKTEVPVTCPKCQKEHPFTVWSSINTSVDPEMKEAVKNRSAFLFKCPSCGEKSYVDYGFLYHQMEERIMIHYANSDENAKEVYKMLTEEDPSGIMTAIQKENYIVRIVRSQDELCEKISIFDEGLDDRIIEIFKVYVLSLLSEEDRKHKKIELLYFHDREKNKVRVTADGDPRGTAEMPMELYEQLRTKYAGKIPDIRSDKSDKLYIDRRWALETMGLI